MPTRLRLSCLALLIIVLVRPNWSWAQASHRLNPGLTLPSNVIWSNGTRTSCLDPPACRVRPLVAMLPASLTQNGPSSASIYWKPIRWVNRPLMQSLRLLSGQTNEPLTSTSSNFCYRLSLCLHNQHSSPTVTPRINFKIPNITFNTLYQSQPACLLLHYIYLLFIYH